MNTRRLTSILTPLRTAAVAAAVVVATLPTTAQTGDNSSAMELYRQDRAACIAGNTSQSQADCLYEARSALRDRRAGNTELEPNGNIGRTAMAGDGERSNSRSTADDAAITSSATSDGSLPARADRN